LAFCENIGLFDAFYDFNVLYWQWLPPSALKIASKKYKYPPEGLEYAIKTVMAQCEMWADEG